MAAIPDRELPVVAGLKLKQKSDHPRYHIPFSDEQIQSLLNKARVKEVSSLPNVYIQKMPRTMPDLWLEGAEYLLRKAEPEDMTSYTEMTRIGALRHLLSEIGTRLEECWTVQNKKANVRYSKREEKRLASLSDAFLKLMGADDEGNITEESRAMLSGQFSGLIASTHGCELKNIQEFASVMHRLRASGLSTGLVGWLGPLELVNGVLRRKKLPPTKPSDYLMRTETFYICELWEHFLHREVRTSVDPTRGEATGPLVTFMKGILSHWHPVGVPSETAIRERIRRFRNPMVRRRQKMHLATHLAPNR